MERIVNFTVRHPTLHKRVAGYLDKVEFVSGVGSDGTRRLHLVGWAFRVDSDQPGEIMFRSSITGVKHTTMSPVRRDDVAKAYQKPEVAMCGFDAFVDCPPAATVDDGAIHYVPLGWLCIDEWGTMSAFLEVPRPAVPPAAAAAAQIPVAPSSMSSLAVRRDPLPTVVVIDDVYAAPLLVREFALRQTFVPHELYHKGQRTNEMFQTEAMKELIELRLGAHIDAKSWDAGPNGCFQWCKAGDQLVYHVDNQQWAGVLFLTPDAPVQCGTSLFRSRATLKRRCDDADAMRAVFGDKFLDATMFEKVDEVGNVFNRLVIFNARHIHAALAYFGADVHDSRLFQMFFFDAAVPHHAEATAV